MKGNCISEEEKCVCIDQIGKDVDRSFINYQEFFDLDDLWRNRQRLSLRLLLELLFVHSAPRSVNSLDEDNVLINYYQGFNTVCSVLLLLKPDPVDILSCCKKLSYHFLLDHLGKDFSQTLIWLQLIPQLLKLVDPRLHEALESLEMSYHFALPWILTWFSHSVTDFRAVLQLFDFFIRNHPVTPVYVAVSLIVHPVIRKKIVSVYSESFDMSEIYGVLQGSAKLISSKGLLEQNESRVPVKELIGIAESIIKEIPVVAVLSTSAASKLSNESVVWRRVYFSSASSSSWFPVSFKRSPRS